MKKGTSNKRLTNSPRQKNIGTYLLCSSKTWKRVEEEEEPTDATTASSGEANDPLSKSNHLTVRLVEDPRKKMRPARQSQLPSPPTKSTTRASLKKPRRVMNRALSCPRLEESLEEGTEESKDCRSVTSFSLLPWDEGNDDEKREELSRKDARVLAETLNDHPPAEPFCDGGFVVLKPNTQREFQHLQNRIESPRSMMQRSESCPRLVTKKKTKRKKAKDNVRTPPVMSPPSLPWEKEDKLARLETKKFSRLNSSRRLEVDSSVESSCDSRFTSPNQTGDQAPLRQQNRARADRRLSMQRAESCPKLEAKKKTRDRDGSPVRKRRPSNLHHPVSPKNPVSPKPLRQVVSPKSPRRTTPTSPGGRGELLQGVGPRRSQGSRRSVHQDANQNTPQDPSQNTPQDPNQRELGLRLMDLGLRLLEHQQQGDSVTESESLSRHSNRTPKSRQSQNSKKPSRSEQNLHTQSPRPCLKKNVTWKQDDRWTES